MCGPGEMSSRLSGKDFSDPMSQIDREAITVVSGLPRSGTSMLMKMLEAGGLEPLTDGVRSADEDNPKGYYEFERVKQLADDRSWLSQAQGRAVKIISALLQHLPGNFSYSVIFLRRKLAQVLASQREMLIRRGEPTDAVSDERMAGLFRAHLRKVENWMETQPNVRVLYVDYNEILKEPLEQARRIDRFLGNALDVARMARVVDRSLYRQRE
jgi:hypothetical protein